MKGFLQLCRSQLLSGISLGLALMVSALFAVYSFEDSTISVRWMNLLPCMTVLYMLAGVLLMAWHRRPPRRRPATPYLSGLNARYIWVLPAFLWWLLFRLTGFDVLERCLLFNLILLAVLWTIEYSMVRRSCLTSSYSPFCGRSSTAWYGAWPRRSTVHWERAVRRSCRPA